MVWDSFDSAAENLTSSDRDELGRFLDAIRGARGKVIMTSRSQEEWIGPTRRFELPLRGLEAEERWEYCEVILRALGLEEHLSDPELNGLMDQLAGNPLAMRVVLPRLEDMPAAKVSEVLRTNITELGLTEQEEQGRLFATLRSVEQGLPEQLRPMMDLIGLHEGYLSANYLEAMAKRVNPDWTRQEIDQLVAALANAGLLRGLSDGIYEIHPLLASYLRSRGAVPEACERAFVDIMGSLADDLAPLEYHEQRGPFLLHEANFHFAQHLSQRLGMDQPFLALTQSLAAYALNSRNFIEASSLLAAVAQHAAARANWKVEAGAYHQLGTIALEQRYFAAASGWCLQSLDISEKAGDLQLTASTYHQLGRIAQEQRDFTTAREWYLQSLTIKEKQGNLRGAALTYHHLGMIAQEQRDFDMTRKWYLKSLAVDETQGNLHGAAATYHQLGMMAQEQRDLATAREWYLKSLAIKEKQGNLLGAANTYHQLGRVAEMQGDIATAREWYLKALTISEKQGILDYAASTYHQLGTIAQQERNFETAREWYLKSLSINEKLGDLYYAAASYGQLGSLALMQGNFEESGKWYSRAITAFQQTHDQHSEELIVQDFLTAYRQASLDEKGKLKAIWLDAGLGPFPA